jgi:hypothetical protein
MGILVLKNNISNNLRRKEAGDLKESKYRK